MGCHVIGGWIIILAMALALTCPRDYMAGPSPQAAAPRLHRQLLLVCMVLTMRYCRPHRQVL